MEKIGETYHDVSVVVNGITYKICDNYAYWLECTKIGGWQLWYRWNNNCDDLNDNRPWNADEKLIGGEYNCDDFKILINDVIICESKKCEEE